MLRGAPFSFVTLAVLCLAGGIGVGTWHSSGQIDALKEQLNTRDGEAKRYRVALGIDEASKGVLIELTNEELLAKTSTTVTKLRDTCFSLRRTTTQLDAEMSGGKIDAKEKWQRLWALNKGFSEQFAKNLRADSFNLDNELRRRLGPAAVAAIVGVPPSVFANNGAPIDIVGLSTGGMGFDVGFTCTIADSIEQMAKLVPPDFAKQ